MRILKTANETSELPTYLVNDRIPLCRLSQDSHTPALAVCPFTRSLHEGVSETPALTLFCFESRVAGSVKVCIV